jgi:hypothetical protein
VLGSEGCAIVTTAPLPDQIKLRSKISDDGKDLMYYHSIASTLSEDLQLLLMKSQVAYNFLFTIMTRSHMPAAVKAVAGIVPQGNAYELRCKFAKLMSENETKQKNHKEHEYDNFVPLAHEPVSTAVLRQFVLVEELSKFKSTKAGNIQSQFEKFMEQMLKSNHPEYVWTHQKDDLIYIPGTTKDLFEVMNNVKGLEGHIPLPSSIPSQVPVLHTDSRQNHRKPQSNKPPASNNRSNHTPSQKPRGQPYPCGRCLQTGHGQRDCKSAPSSKAIQCKKCKLYGHTLERCFSNNNASSSNSTNP